MSEDTNSGEMVKAPEADGRPTKVVTEEVINRRRERLMAALDVAEKSADFVEKARAEQEMIRAGELTVLQEIANHMARQFDELDLNMISFARIVSRVSEEAGRGIFKGRIRRKWVTERKIEKVRVLNAWSERFDGRQYCRALVGVTQQGELLAVMSSDRKNWDVRQGSGGKKWSAPRIHDELSGYYLEPYWSEHRRWEEENLPRVVELENANFDALGIDVDEIIEAAQTALACHIGQLEATHERTKGRKNSFGA